jgi:hypothetical protein
MEYNPSDPIVDEHGGDRRVERYKFLSVQRELKEKFGGYSNEDLIGGPYIQGEYVAQNGATYADTNVRYEVIVQQDVYDGYFLDLFTRLKSEDLFRQDSIFMTKEAIRWVASKPPSSSWKNLLPRGLLSRYRLFGT